MAKDSKLALCGTTHLCRYRRINYYTNSRSYPNLAVLQIDKNSLSDHCWCARQHRRICLHKTTKRVIPKLVFSSHSHPTHSWLHHTASILPTYSCPICCLPFPCSSTYFSILLFSSCLSSFWWQWIKPRPWKTHCLHHKHLLLSSSVCCPLSSHWCSQPWSLLTQTWIKPTTISAELLKCTITQLHHT